MAFRTGNRMTAQEQSDMNELFSLISSTNKKQRKPVAKDAVTVSNEEYATEKKYWDDLQKKNNERASNKATSSVGNDAMTRRNAKAAKPYSGFYKPFNLEAEARKYGVEV